MTFLCRWLFFYTYL